MVDRLLYMDEKLAILVTNLIVILQWGNMGGEGEGEVEIIHMCIYMCTWVTTCLNAKKRKILQLLKRGIYGWPTCIKSKGDKIGMAWSDTPTSPILLQRSPSTIVVMHIHLYV